MFLRETEITLSGVGRAVEGVWGQERMDKINCRKTCCYNKIPVFNLKWINHLFSDGCLVDRIDALTSFFSVACWKSYSRSDSPQCKWIQRKGKFKWETKIANGIRDTMNILETASSLWWDYGERQELLHWSHLTYTQMTWWCHAKRSLKQERSCCVFPSSGLHFRAFCNFQ